MTSGNYLRTLKIDLARNKGNTKGQFIIFLYRGCRYFFLKKNNLFFFLTGLPLIIFYKIVVEYLLAVNFPVAVCADPGLVIYHGQGLVVHEKTSIGTNVTLRHNTTIGSKSINDDGKAPIIEDGVNVGANAVILGEITVGAGSIVGAGAVVVQDVPPESIVVGNPAKVLKNVH